MSDGITILGLGAIGAAQSRGDSEADRLMYAAQQMNSANLIAKQCLANPGHTHSCADPAHTHGIGIFDPGHSHGIAMQVAVETPVRGQQSERRVAEMLSRDACDAMEYLMEDFASYLKA